MIHIHRVETSAGRDVRRFIRFPFRLYRGCPQWVPPLLSAERKRFDREAYAFYQHSDAGFFLALQGRDVVGRIAVLEPRRRNAYRGERTALFYLFDAVDDEAVSRALFDAGFGWARQRGLDRMLGPEGFMTGDGFGILIDGFQYPPAMGIPYNYPYYRRLVEAAGFEKWADFTSYRLPGDLEIPQRLLDLAQRVRERRDLRIVHFEDEADMRALAPQVIEAYNAAFETNPRFVPVTGADAEAIIDRLLSITRPDLLKVVARGDEVVGFVLVFPNVSRALQRCRGRLFPFGWALLLWEARHTRWFDFNGGGILPQYQGLGANIVLYEELMRMAHACDAELVDLVQVNENNPKMLREMEMLGVAPVKVHRQVERAL